MRTAPMTEREIVALATECSEILKLALQPRIDRGELPPVGYVLVAAEIGPGGGHIGYASTVDRPDAVDLLRKLLANLNTHRS